MEGEQKQKRRFYRKKKNSDNKEPKDENINTDKPRTTKPSIKKPNIQKLNNIQLKAVSVNKEKLNELAYRLVNTKELSIINKNDKFFTYKVTLDPSYNYKLSIPVSPTQPLLLSTLIINTETLSHSQNTIKNFNSKAKAKLADKQLKYSPLFLINYLVNNHASLALVQQDYKRYENNKLILYNNE